MTRKQGGGETKLRLYSLNPQIFTLFCCQLRTHSGARKNQAHLNSYKERVTWVCRAGEEHNVRCKELVRDNAHILRPRLYLSLFFFFFLFPGCKGNPALDLIELRGLTRLCG